MRPVRASLAVAGTLLLAYGGWLLFHRLQWTPEFLLQTGAWLVAGPPLHDAVVAPIVTVVGLLLARRLPRPWRAAVSAGLITTGVLVLVGIPLLTRPRPAPLNPGLDDRDYLPGLLLYVGVLWALIIAGTALYAVALRGRQRRQG